MLPFFHCIEILFNMFLLHLFHTLLFHQFSLPILIYQLLWMLLDGVVRGGCKECITSSHLLILQFWNILMTFLLVQFLLLLLLHLSITLFHLFLWHASHLTPNMAVHNMGKMDVVCSNCGALHWASERLVNSPGFGMCCFTGKVKIPRLEDPPPELLHLLSGQEDLC